MITVCSSSLPGREHMFHIRGSHISHECCQVGIQGNNSHHNSQGWTGRTMDHELWPLPIKNAPTYFLPSVPKRKHLLLVLICNHMTHGVMHVNRCPDCLIGTFVLESVTYPRFLLHRMQKRASSFKGCGALSVD